jgi:hypothetical protein
MCKYAVSSISKWVSVRVVFLNAELAIFQLYQDENLFNVMMMMMPVSVLD